LTNGAKPRPSALREREFSPGRFWRAWGGWPAGLGLPSAFPVEKNVCLGMEGQSRKQMVTHNREEARRFTDTVFVLENGKLVPQSNVCTLHY